MSEETVPAVVPAEPKSAGTEAPSAAPDATIATLGQHEGQSVKLHGWLYNSRESGKLLFPIFRDGTGIMQGVVSLKENPEAFAALKGLPIESSVIVTGAIRAEVRAPGGFELPAFFAICEAQTWPSAVIPDNG